MHDAGWALASGTTWVAAVPKLAVGHTYILRVTALDRADNSQVVFIRGANLARFSIKR